ncbi:Sugar phosphatase YfbT [Arsenophonus endosymbiont of Bemisia tabaci Q2]|nr:Sugar phosphatase YfbT [Arsenophonus endosymbiont of Bemisia tabaci Q2]
MIWIARWLIRYLMLYIAGENLAVELVYQKAMSCTIFMANQQSVLSVILCQIPQKLKFFYWLENLEAANTSGIVALPGAIALLEQLNTFAIPWAIVTSGIVPIAFNRSKAPGLPEPKHWVTIERVEHGKPQPDPFLLGAQLLNLPAEACIEVEDAQAGIYFALDAGCEVIAVHAPAGMPRREEISLIIKSFTELNISKLNNQGIVTVTQR